MAASGPTALLTLLLPCPKLRGAAGLSAAAVLGVCSFLHQFQLPSSTQRTQLWAVQCKQLVVEPM